MIIVLRVERTNMLLHTFKLEAHAINLSSGVSIILELSFVQEVMLIGVWESLAQRVLGILGLWKRDPQEAFCYHWS